MFNDCQEEESRLMNDVEECANQQHQKNNNKIIKDDDITRLLSNACAVSSSSQNLYDDLDLADSEEKALLDLLDLNNIATGPSATPPVSTATQRGPQNGATSDLLSLNEFVDTSSSSVVDSDFTRIIRSLKVNNRERLTPDCKLSNDKVAGPTSGMND